ncbi:hypothetical protein [Candidatus Arthromitus sp. SFB-rat-Yit]|uniref:hypothetical protein n=1 Tax=Candidatus Arthromitus sp. SFB-rat-Yit TaxID=1041504 RepID=UPI000227A26C|nr:hypothetical protein [Candidatus Arthromitus sp. SFB-rat-Yit]BAK80795.1 hypothetical protein RATSFB_0233 [Candidatus Arthromitus sp. SFB-rat-Yit]
MRRSSIFSREYEKKIRKKRFIILILILTFLIIGVFYIVNFSKINNYLRDKYYSLISKEISNTNEIEVDKYDENDTNNINEETRIPLEENIDNNELDRLIYNVILGDNELKISYMKDENNIKFLGLIDTLDSKYSFDISPNKQKILIENNITQDVYMVDSILNTFKLDPEFFYSNSAKNRFYKNDIRNTYENYAWYKSAKFLDDNTVVYVSNLPWFGRNEQYVWRTDVSDTQDIKHFMTSIAGENIEFGELTEHGIKVNINNEMKLLTFSFVLN